MNNLLSNNDDQGKKDRELIRREASYSFSGPLPHPDILGKFDEIVPGAAERIIKMAEDQFSHRVEIENKVINSDISRSKWGQILGFVIAMAGIGGAVLLGLSGQPWPATILGGGTLVSLVYVFMYGSRTRSEERKQKSQEKED